MSIEKQVQDILDNAVKAYKGCGMQFCAIKDDQCVVNACAGFTSEAMTEKVNTRTLFPVYSTSKTVPATALTRLIAKGKISPDQLVTDIWPEFGKNGKEKTLVRHLLNHTSGLPQRFKEQSSYEAVCDWEYMIHTIENSHCDWTPGTQARYQSLTYGWVTMELVQRITGMSFKEYIAKELGLKEDGDFIFGTNDEIEKRISDFRLPSENDKTSGFTICDPLDDLMRQKCIREAVLPGFNGFASAYGLANFMNKVNNCDYFSRRVLMDAISPEYSPAKDNPVIGSTKIFGYGFALTGPAGDLGKFYGHGGYGGSFAIADRDNNITCGFTTNIIGGQDEIRDELFKLFGIERCLNWKKEEA